LKRYRFRAPCLWLIPFPSLAQISFLGHRQHAILVGGNNRLKPALRLMSDYRLVIEEIKEAKANNELHPMGGCRTSARGIWRVISVRFNLSQADSRAGKDSVRILVYVRDPAHPQGYGVRAPAAKCSGRTASWRTIQVSRSAAAASSASH